IRNLSSGNAVMKMTGMQWPSASSRSCRSRPEQTRQLYIAVQARRLRKAPGFQKPLGGLEGGDRVPQRLDEVAERLSDKIVVIDNGNHVRVPRNHGLSMLYAEKAIRFHCTGVAFPGHLCFSLCLSHFLPLMRRNLWFRSQRISERRRGSPAA